MSSFNRVGWFWIFFSFFFSRAGKCDAKVSIETALCLQHDSEASRLDSVKPQTDDNRISKVYFGTWGKAEAYCTILCLMEDSLLVSKKQQHLSQVCLCSKRSITRHTGYLAHHNTQRLLRIICLVGIISSSEYTVEWLCTQRAISSLCR